MHLPGPLRAAVGLVALAADEAKTLPDRAVEIPMRAVGTALQVSLRAQQRYARLAARGERVLNRQEPGAEPPEWATFDDPLSVEDLHRAALAQLEDLGTTDATGTAGSPDDADARAASVMIEDIFGVSDPAATVSGDTAAPPAEPKPDATVVPISQAQGGARKSARKTPVKKAAVKKTPAARKTTPPAKKAPVAKKTTPVKKATPAKKAGKQINKPRHGAPSKFDDAGD